MSKVTNGDLMEVLLELKGDIGGLKASSAGHSAWMAKHVEDDALMAADIKKLQLAHARQRGFLTAVTGIASAVGAGVVTFLSKTFLGHH